MAEGELGRREALGEQPLRSVEIGEQRVEQAGALHDAGLDAAPLVGATTQRQRVEVPGAVGALRVGVDVVGDAVVDDQPARQFDAAPRGASRPSRPQAVEQTAPVLARRALRVDHLVVAGRLQERQRHVAQPGRSAAAQVERERKVRVHGAGGGRGASRPGVWPMRSKRARRRLSDSKALTGSVLVVAPARMHHVVSAAAERAAGPGVEQVEGQRRVHADGRMQRRRRLPGAIAHARRRTRRPTPVGCSGSAWPLQVIA